MLHSFVIDCQQRAAYPCTHTVKVLCKQLPSSVTHTQSILHASCFVIRWFEAFVSLSVPNQVSSEEAPLLTGSSSMETVQRLWYTNTHVYAHKEQGNYAYGTMYVHWAAIFTMQEASL